MVRGNGARPALGRYSGLLGVPHDNSPGGWKGQFHWGYMRIYMGGYRVYGSGFRVLGSKVLGIWDGSEGLMLRIGASS